MYAIVTIAGKQYKVEPGRYLYVDRLPQAEGENLTLNEVLLIDNDGAIQVGLPTVTGATVNAKVLAHVKADKVLVFKKKRRKGYQKLNGHRQKMTRIQIESISMN